MGVKCLTSQSSFKSSPNRNNLLGSVVSTLQVTFSRLEDLLLTHRADLTTFLKRHRKIRGVLSIRSAAAPVTAAKLTQSASACAATAVANASNPSIASVT